MTVDPNVSKATAKFANKRGDGIRPRPKNVYGAFRLCRHYIIRRSCPSGDQCCFAHSEAEKIAWEDDRKKGT